MVVLGGGEVIAAAAENLLRSQDHGCTWDLIGISPTGPSARLVASAAGVVYGWLDDRPVVLRIADGVVTSVARTPGEVRGLGVDPTDPNRLRIVDGEGQLWTSTNGGATFVRTGEPAARGLEPVYGAAFDLRDLDLVHIGLGQRGAWWTDDGGRAWHAAAGFGAGRPEARGLLVSPASRDVVWAFVRDVDARDAPDHGRGLWRSTDGGQSYVRLLAYNPGFQLPNDPPPLAAHPTDADVLYFAWRSPATEPPGLYTFRYDAVQAVLTRAVSAPRLPGALAFAPGDPSVLYLGIDKD